jgi:hypothetical protein
MLDCLVVVGGLLGWLEWLAVCGRVDLFLACCLAGCPPASSSCLRPPRAYWPWSMNLRRRHTDTQASSSSGASAPQRVGAIARGGRPESDKRPSSPLSWSTTTTSAAAAAALGIGCCYTSLEAQLVYDDRALVVENEDLRPSTPWMQLLAHDYWGTALSDPRSHTSWRPVTVASLKANFHACGLEPAPYHATNLALHGCNCALVVYATAGLLLAERSNSEETAATAGAGGRRMVQSLLTGLLFAAHPVHTEAVANVAGRAELLAALCALAAFVCFMHSGSSSSSGPITTAAVASGPPRRYRTQDTRGGTARLLGLWPAWLRGLGVACLFLLGTLAKETGFTVLGVIWVHELTCGLGALPRIAALLRCSRGAAAAAAKPIPPRPSPRRRVDDDDGGRRAAAAAAAITSPRRSGMVPGVVTRHAWLLCAAVGYLASRRQLAHSFSPQISRRDNHIALHPSWRVRAASYAALHARYAALLWHPATLSADYSFDSIPLEGLPHHGHGHETTAWQQQDGAVASTGGGADDDVMGMGAGRLPPPSAASSSASSSSSLSGWWVGAAVLLYAALAALGLAATLRDDRTLAVGLAWLVVPFMPAANVLFPVATIIGERLLYMPSIGFCMLVVHGAMLLWRSPLLGGGSRGEAGEGRRRWTGGWLLLLGGALIGCGAARSLARCRDWHDEASLFRSATAAQPRSARAHYNRGSPLLQRAGGGGEGGANHTAEALLLLLREASSAFLRTLTIDPAYDQAWNNLGAAYEARAEWDMAASAYTALAAVRGSGSDPYAHNSKGRALSKLPVREQGGGLTHIEFWTRAHEIPACVSAAVPTAVGGRSLARRRPFHGPVGWRCRSRCSGSLRPAS